MSTPSRSAIVLSLALFGAATLGACTSTESSGLGTLGTSGMDDFDAASGREPSANSLNAVARLCLAQGRTTEAQNVLHNILEKDPEFLPAYEELAQSYAAGGQIESAVAVLNLGLEKAPHDPILLNDLGMCQLLQKDYGTALQSFTQAAAGAPSDARCRANMAVALGLLGRVDEALSLYLQVMPPAEAHWNVGVLSAAISDATRAQREFADSGTPLPIAE
jgi:Flp pilus assembly protein TadD